MERFERRLLIDVVDSNIIGLADKFCRKVRKSTGVGGSHELKVGLTAIPWVCTMLAAENLGSSSQFNKSVAMSKSATKSKDFNIVLETCKNVLNSKPSIQPAKLDVIPLSFEELIQEYELPKSRLDDCKYLMEHCLSNLQANEPAKYKGAIDDLHKNEFIAATFWTMGASLNVHELPTRSQFGSDWQLKISTFQKYCETLDYYAKEELDMLKRTGNLSVPDSPVREVGLEQLLATPSKRRRIAAEQADIKRSEPGLTPRRTRSNDALSELQSRKSTPQKQRTSNSTTPTKNTPKSSENSQTPRRALARALRQQRLETVKEQNESNLLANTSNNFIDRWCFTDNFNYVFSNDNWNKFLQLRSSIKKQRT